ncbi:outer membrane protein assembly factor BamB family protein [Cellulomonas edaphi]|uniref:PQQ-binding-like beta-propeller repeat protein n=1 Tax=Cellulomonas edaphi TaxID=3053468 RepID=A0ABT7S9X5_9CELL|nr:PQQ-binding-like beta-propeller repeat protein [Cellulomons edaphi]MDM7832329.1 PQQ-binding-like beta-propeller repeat protein [Cellulomons edaphi]
MDRDAVRPVELVEDDERPDAPLPPSRWRRWWPVPVVLALLAVGAQAGLDARARAQDARIASLPGTLAPVGDTVTARWTVAPGDVDVVSAGFEVAGAFVGLRQEGEGYAAVALGAGGGGVRWRTVLDADEARAPRCAAGDTGSARLYCMVEAPGSDGGSLLEIDARDGAVLGTTALPPADTFARVDAHTTYVALARGESSCDVSAVVDTRVRWTSRVACGVEPQLVVGGGLVALSSWGEQVTVLTRAGDVLEEQGSAGAEVLGDALVVVTLDDAGTGTSRLLRAGKPPVAVAGSVMVPRVDDGSAAGVVVTADRSTQGFDARTGERLWRYPVPLSGTYLVRGGKVVGSSSQDMVVAIDARSGTVQHRAALRRDALPMAPVTDGLSFLTILRGAPSDPPRLVGVPAVGGGGVLEVTLPGGLLGLRQEGRRLVASGTDGTVWVLG